MRKRGVVSGDNFTAIMRVNAPTLGRGEGEVDFKKHGGLRVARCGRFGLVLFVNNADPTNKHVIYEHYMRASDLGIKCSTNFHE